LAEHVIDATRVHHHWDNALEPSLRIAPGDVVHRGGNVDARHLRQGATLIVDAGVWNVGFTMPLEVFTDDAEKR